MKRFYLEFDSDSEEYFVIEREGGCEHGEYFDITCFEVVDRHDAANAVDILNKLYEKAKDK
jgi:hypothetical protein